MAFFHDRDAVFRHAIRMEKESVRFYEDWAARVEKPIMRVVLTEFAHQEREHVKALEDIRQGRWSLLPADEVVESLHLSELAYDIPPTPDMSYGEALVVAMKREKKSFEIYQAFAEATTDPGLVEVFRSLAQQEARHKLHFEVEYDEYLFHRQEGCEE